MRSINLSRRSSISGSDDPSFLPSFYDRREVENIAHLERRWSIEHLFDRDFPGCLDRDCPAFKAPWPGGVACALATDDKINLAAVELKFQIASRKLVAAAGQQASRRRIPRRRQCCEGLGIGNEDVDIVTDPMPVADGKRCTAPECPARPLIQSVNERSGVAQQDGPVGGPPFLSAVPEKALGQLPDSASAIACHRLWLSTSVCKMLSHLIMSLAMSLECPKSRHRVRCQRYARFRYPPLSLVAGAPYT